MKIDVLGIPVEITKKKIKNIYLSALPPDGKIRVSAPEYISNEKLIMFISSKADWIKKQRTKFKNLPKQPERQYISGETLYLWGKRYFLQTEHSHKGNSLVIDDNKAILTVRKESSVKQRENFVNERYRELLKSEISNLLPKWENITELHCSCWQIKNMKTRWGTCNVQTKKIWLNLQLAKYPVECLEYVILHELAHTKVKNHGADFIAIMDKYMPNWRERKKKLNNSIF